MPSEAVVYHAEIRFIFGRDDELAGDVAAVGLRGEVVKDEPPAAILLIMAADEALVVEPAAETVS